VPRHRLKAELSNVLDLLMNKKKGQDQRTLSVVSAKPEKVLKSQKALALPL
jgi:hypothetical protein